jgi:subtilisin family serine protease
MEQPYSVRCRGAARSFLLTEGPKLADAWYSQGRTSLLDSSTCFLCDKFDSEEIMLIWMPRFVAVEQPDISAPGVGILAAWSPHVAVSITANDDRRVPYNIVSGTSVANPHVTGAAAYVKAAHPDWSPAAVISSLVTSGSSLIQLTTASYIFTSTQVGFFLWHRLLIGH